MKGTRQRMIEDTWFPPLVPTAMERCYPPQSNLVQELENGCTLERTRSGLLYFCTGKHSHFRPAKETAITIHTHAQTWIQMCAWCSCTHTQAPHRRRYYCPHSQMDAPPPSYCRRVTSPNRTNPLNADTLVEDPPPTTTEERRSLRLVVGRGAVHRQLTRDTDSQSGPCKICSRDIRIWLLTAMQSQRSFL